MDEIIEKLREESKSPVVVLTVGIPGCGKSTLVKRIVNELDFHLVSSDQIIDEHAQKIGSHYDKIFKEYTNVATHLMWRRFHSFINDGKNIILDRTNLTIDSRKHVFDQIPFSYKIVVINVHVTEEDHKKFIEKRALSGGKVVPNPIVRAMTEELQFCSEMEERVDLIIDFHNRWRNEFI